MDTSELMKGNDRGRRQARRALVAKVDGLMDRLAKLAIPKNHQAEANALQSDLSAVRH